MTAWTHADTRLALGLASRGPLSRSGTLRASFGVNNCIRFSNSVFWVEKKLSAIALS